nr:hypothetical protein [Tanacetum cinerariifolium]
MCELACQIFQKKQEEKQIEEEQAANARYRKIPAYCDDDDDYDFAITPILSTKEPIDSLSMGGEHLDTISATKSDEVIKSSVEDLVPIPKDKRIEEKQAAKARYWKIPACFDDDDDYDFAITPVLSTEETDNSLSMGDEHLDTIPATESDEVIKSSVEDLVPIPSESEGIPDTMCDVHLVNNPTPLEAKDHFENVINSKDDISSSDEDSLYNENIESVEASPYDSELVSLEAAEIVIPKVEEIEDDNLRKKLLNVHLLIGNIEALKDNLTPSSEFLTKSSSISPKSFLEETNTFHNSLPEFENFCFDLEKISSGSTTTHSDISLPDYEVFSFNNDHIK